MGLKLSSPPGFADLADSVLASGSPALGVDIAKIHENSRFSMARTEVFSGVYKNGDTVSVPISPIDGYAYSRNELKYFWTIRNSADPSTLWISGADSLFNGAWDVDQTTGKVFSDEWYRRSGSHADVFHSNDGLLQVWTVGQRQLADLVVASSPSYSAITAGWMALDKPLTQQLAQGLNRNAKFACLNHEFFYLGDYSNGQTATLPTSPADGHVYSAGECKFLFSWRWTSVGSVVPMQAPPLVYGQMGPMKASVNSSGVVTCSVGMIDENGNLNQISSLGRVAVFAFCQRTGTPGTITPTANAFAEVSFDNFMPGSDLPFGTLQQIQANIQEGLLTPEFFGPTTYANGNTVSLPTSPKDSYAYARSECTYLWNWSDTSNQTGSDLRMPLFNGHIDPLTGVVTLHVWRLPPGGPYIDDNDSLARISVMVVARRAASAPAALSAPTTATPSDVGTPGQQDIPAGGGGLQVNGVAIPSPEIGNLNDLVPAVPTGECNVKWQADTLDPTNISAHVRNVGGVDARTTTTESLGIASQGKLVTFNNAGAVAVTLDSTAGGGGGGVTSYDMLAWITTGYPTRTTNHYTGSGVYAAHWMDADGQKVYLVKNTAGNPYDIYVYDSNWIYHWLTENADEGTWSSANAWKRFITPVPVIPRFFVPGSTVTKTTNGSNPIERTTACGTDGEPLINIGNVTAVTTGPVTVAWGGSVGTQPTITVTYYYGHQREEFKYVQNVGLVEWTHASLSGGSYHIDQTTQHLTLASGGCPTPNVPCYATMLAAGKWIGGAPGSGGNVANPGSSPPTPGAVPSTFYCWVKNLGVGSATFTPSSGTINGLSNISLSTGQGAGLFFDGTNWQAVTSSGTTVNTFGVVSGVAGKPGASQLVCIYTAFSAQTFPANFGSPQQAYGSVGVNPTATASYTVNKNGSSVGTISISTGGVFTFTTSGGTSFSLAVGDRLTIVAPSSQDATLADVGDHAGRNPVNGSRLRPKRIERRESRQLARQSFHLE
jgi:hypothetical protein